ncbi:hypothetical protein Scep_002177 [Stephania cephalantha]|uniref:Uncharacterized protein n=1 Tax=Stephania cephalantha TaxID=152367 RepID=A0AAP0L9P5_9MAGN
MKSLRVSSINPSFLSFFSSLIPLFFFSLFSPIPPLPKWYQLVLSLRSTMTEGMVTRAKATDDVISKLQKQADLYASNHELILATLQQHSDAIARNATVCDKIRKLLLETPSRAPAGGKQPSSGQPPLLPTPSYPCPSRASASSSSYQAPIPEAPNLPNSVTPASSYTILPSPYQLRIPKLEIPVFLGRTGCFRSSNFFFTTKPLRNSA